MKLLLALLIALLLAARVTAEETVTISASAEVILATPALWLSAFHRNHYRELCERWLIAPDNVHISNAGHVPTFEQACQQLARDRADPCGARDEVRALYRRGREGMKIPTEGWRLFSLGELRAACNRRRRVGF